MTCEFCGKLSNLLCDGRVWTNEKGEEFRAPVEVVPPVGWKDRSCDKPVCRACASKIGDVHIHARGGCRWDTRDLCPLCRVAQEEREKEKAGKAGEV